MNDAMKTKLLIIAFFVAIMVSCGLFEQPKYPVVGTWEGHDYEQSVNHTAEFKNNLNFYLKEEQHKVIEEGDAKRYFHHYKKFWGTYGISENIVTLHFTKIQYRDAEIYNHENVLDTTINIPPFADEVAKYEMDENRNQLTLIRHFGTDSVQTQVYHRVLIK